AAGRAAREPRRVPRILWHGATAWLSACAFFVFYPPIWPPLLLVVCAAIFDLRWRARNSPAAALRAALPSIVLVGRGVALACAAWALLAVWLLVPMPAWFGVLTLLQLAPWNRAWFIFGFSTALLSAARVAELTDAALPAALRAKEIAAAAVFLCGALALAVAVAPGAELETVDRWNHFAPFALATGAALAGIALLQTQWGPRLLALGWALPLV